MSSNSTKNVDILNNHGRTTQANESNSSESPISEEANRRTSENESKKPAEPKHTEDISEKRKGKQAVQDSTKTEMKGYLSKDYRDLLNSAIDEAAGVSNSDYEVLSPSHAGRSLWMSKEKEAFFHALSTKGRDDLTRISRTIGTKSEIEVRSYLLSLQASCSDGESPSPVGDSSRVDVPASFEIRGRCEHAIELTAEALGRHVLQYDIQMEKEKFDDVWLIDDELAARIEKEVRRQERGSAIDAAGCDTENADEPNAESRSEDDESAEPPQRSGSGPDKTGIFEDIPAAKFLKPEAFLQLSRSLFMNSAVEPECNWSQIGPANGGFEGPAIFHSAFENFHNIAINFTRWLVQATAFQTISRLRAKDEQNPAVIVTTEDVKTALNFLNLSFDWKKYWSGTARRSGVDVYSDSDRYRDGRPGTKNGRLLTCDEVETELGYPPTGPSSDHAKDIREESSDSKDSSESEGSSEDDSDDEDMSDDDVDGKANSSENLEKTNKRKRPADMSSDDEKEDEYLDCLDVQASRAEERRLMEMLRYSISPSPEMEEVPEEHVRRKRARIEKQYDWRDRVSYMAEWEQPGTVRKAHPSDEDGRE